MTEYIEREKLQEALKREKSTITTQRYTDGWNDCMLRVKSIVHSAPTAEVEPVRHGWWIDAEEPIPWLEDDVDIVSYCSICGAINGLGKTTYCPNCGARCDLGGADNA